MVLTWAILTFMGEVSAAVSASGYSIAPRMLTNLRLQN
jgi:hypothetical protein